MTRRHYKNEGIIKLLVVLAGIIALVTILFGILGLGYYGYYAPNWYYGYGITYYIIWLVVGLVISILTIMCGMRRESKHGGEILPWHWLTFLILAILIIIFGGGIIACILLIIAFLVALIEDL